MIHNRITEYVNEYSKDTVYAGKTYLNREGYFIDGDEDFYHFIGRNSCYTFIELMHPDDVEEVKQAMINISVKPQHCIGRVKGNDDEYYFLYFVLSESDRIIDGYHPTLIEFGTFISLREKYVKYATDLRKYQMFLSFFPYFFYEYDYDTDVLIIYQYINQKCAIMFNEKMKSFQNTILSEVKLSDSERVDFFNFYDRLASNTQRCQIQVLSKFFAIPRTGDLYVFKGAMLYGDGKRKNVGIIETTDARNKQGCYYLSENAFDPGTGVFNKRAINEYAVEKIKECHVKQASMYLSVIDVDDFKNINDTYGHMFGDEVLARIAEIIRSVVDTRGFCGRFGGDEFMLVLDRVDSEKELREILKTINKNVYFAFAEKDIHLTLSCGISKYPVDGFTFEDLFLIADKAVYIAKKKGKNRYIIYDPEKHDMYENTEAKVRNLGVHALADVSKKAKVMTELILELHKNGIKKFPYIMEVVRDYFDIDGIAVYCGDELKRVCSSGNYIEPIEKLDCMLKTTYFTLFGEQGVYMESILKKLKNFYPIVYEQFSKQENEKFIQFVAYKNDTPYVLISFDYFNRSPKLGASDLSLITMIGRLMAEIYASS